MGKKKKLVTDEETEIILDLLERGGTVPEIAKELEVSPPTLREKIASLQNEQGLLLQYRNIQSLQLTQLQHQVLNAITPDKIQEASLKDLISAFKVLKEKEHLIEGKPSEIKGLVQYLVEIEKEELGLATPVYYDDKKPVIEHKTEEDDLPNL